MHGLETIWDAVGDIRPSRAGLSISIITHVGHGICSLDVGDVVPIPRPKAVIDLIDCRYPNERDSRTSAVIHNIISLRKEEETAR